MDSIIIATFLLSFFIFTALISSVATDRQLKKLDKEMQEKIKKIKSNNYYYLEPDKIDKDLCYVIEPDGKIIKTFRIEALKTEELKK